MGGELECIFRLCSFLLRDSASSTSVHVAEQLGAETIQQCVCVQGGVPVSGRSPPRLLAEERARRPHPLEGAPLPLKGRLGWL